MSAEFTRAALVQFDTWAEMPEAERAGWLTGLAAREPAVYQRLLALIQADERASGATFLLPPVAPASLVGKMFGPWRVTSLIGTGGMAQVWLARRVDGLFEGMAAIKLLRLAALDAAASERFAREGQMLARLSHPNIARLLDAGVTAAGERFLVLEYIDGARIDSWCNRRRLTLTQRIELFIVVCKAVAHAHENLVVHRDLKPTNIFVTSAGEVKLLDFGIAKLLDDEAGPGGKRQDLTREVGAALTPVYAAPEQIASGPISTATDVYALGVVLYELLNGARPPVRANPDDLQEPLWSLQSPSDETMRIAEERATSVKTLRKALRGDVALVVAKAMRSNPSERYHSALELAEDLRRVLENRPVHASPESKLYRARKYLQRHVVAVSIASLMLLSIVAGVTGTVISSRAAVREAQRAVAVKRFLLDLFEQARGSLHGGVEAREATLNDLLQAGADRVEAAFASQPEIRDEVFQILVELYTDTGTRQQTEQLARRRLAAARSAFGRDDPRTAPAEVMLGAALINYGELDEARGLLSDAQRLLDAAGDRTSIERARLLRWQGTLLSASGTTAVPWASHPLRQAVELLRSRYESDDELLAALAQMPALACEYGQPDEGLKDANELYERTMARYGRDNIYITEANLMRANLLQMNDRAADAVPILEEVLPQMRKYVGEQNPNVVAVMAHLAVAYRATGRAADSERTLAAARSIADRDPDNGHIARILKRADQRIAALRAGQTLRCGSPARS